VSMSKAVRAYTDIMLKRPHNQALQLCACRCLVGMAYSEESASILCEEGAHKAALYALRNHVGDEEVVKAACQVRGGPLPSSHSCHAFGALLWYQQLIKECSTPCSTGALELGAAFTHPFCLVMRGGGGGLLGPDHGETFMEAGCTCVGLQGRSLRSNSYWRHV
jgi:hypothetical protein